MNEINKNNIMIIFKGTIISIILTIILLFVFAALLVYTNISESLIEPLVIVISSLSILIGSIISTKQVNKSGLIKGGIIGFLYMILIYILSSISALNFNFDTKTIIMTIASIICGIIGGIIGVNIGCKK